MVSEPLLGDPELFKLAFPAEQAPDRHATVLEEEFARVLRVEAELLELRRREAAPRDPGNRGVKAAGRSAPLPGGAAGSGGHGDVSPLRGALPPLSFRLAYPLIVCSTPGRPRVAARLFC